MLADFGLVVHDYIYWRFCGWDLNEHVRAIQIVGNVLTGVFFVIRLVQDTLLAGVGAIAGDSDAFDLSKSSWLRQDEVMMRYKDVLFREWNNGTMRTGKSSAVKFNQLINNCCLGMLLLSMFVTYKFLYGNFKNYSLFHLKNLAGKTNIKRVDVKTHAEPLGNNSSVKDILIALYSILMTRGVNEDFGDDQAEIVDTEYYELKKWVPSKLLLGFMVSFSPTILYFLKFTTVSFLSVVPVLLHQIVLHMIIMERYEARIADDNLLTKEHIKGYEDRFVKPRETKIYQDVMLDTIDLDYGGYVKFFPSEPNKLFKRHRINGDLVIEKYNKKNGTFDNITRRIVNDKPTKNKIFPVLRNSRPKQMDSSSVITLKNRILNTQQNSKEAVAMAKPVNNDFYDDESAEESHFLSDNDSDEKLKLFPATPLRQQRR